VRELGVTLIQEDGHVSGAAHSHHIEHGVAVEVGHRETATGAHRGRKKRRTFERIVGAAACHQRPSGGSGDEVEGAASIEVGHERWAVGEARNRNDGDASRGSGGRANDLEARRIGRDPEDRQPSVAPDTAHREVTDRPPEEQRVIRERPIPPVR
jgi:hypothetical protein